MVSYKRSAHIAPFYRSPAGLESGAESTRVSSSNMRTGKHPGKYNPANKETSPHPCDVTCFPLTWPPVMWPWRHGRPCDVTGWPHDIIRWTCDISIMMSSKVIIVTSSRYQGRIWSSDIKAGQVYTHPNANCLFPLLVFLIKISASWKFVIKPIHHMEMKGLICVKTV